MGPITAPRQEKRVGPALPDARGRSGSMQHEGRVGDLDRSRVDVAFVDAKPVEDHQLGDFFLRGEALEVRTQPRPHVRATVMHEKILWSLNPLGFVCTSEYSHSAFRTIHVVSLYIIVRQRT